MILPGAALYERGQGVSVSHQGEGSAITHLQRAETDSEHSDVLGRCIVAGREGPVNGVGRLVGVSPNIDFVEFTENSSLRSAL